MHASKLLDTWPALTRMYTTISPDEMTEDPIFHTTPSLPSVAQLRQAYQSVLLNGDSIVRLPDEREVYVPSGAPWPAIPGAASSTRATPTASFEIRRSAAASSSTLDGSGALRRRGRGP